MSSSPLPERASLEYLKKLAKDRLQELRRTDPHAQLATALLAVAQDHGFSSWRAVKAEIEQRQNKNTALFFEGCAKGEVDVLLRGDREAMRRLHAAGATQPPEWENDRNRRREGPNHQTGFRATMAAMADSIKKGVPMISVPDVGRTLDWYTSIGFNELARYEDDGVVSFGMVSFGRAELMLNTGGASGRQHMSFWFYTDSIDQLYRIVKSRQIEAAQAALAGDLGDRESVEVVQDLYEPFYGGREFGIRDPNGYVLNFLQPADVNGLRFAHERTDL